MGYHVTTVTPANRQPSAQAELPSMMILPAVPFMRSARHGSVLVKVLAAYSKPAWAAPQFISAALALRAPNCFIRALCTSCMSMESNCATTPS